MGRLSTIVATVLVAATAAHAAEGWSAAPVSRDDDPVVLRGTAMSTLMGRRVDEIGVFRYDAALGSFVPVRHQVDERVAETFNPGTPLEFVETIYDIFHEEDGTLDDDDELAIRLGDGGPRAPTSAPWPGGAEDLRLELEVTDGRPGEEDDTYYLYVYTGSGLAQADGSYVTWDLSATSPVVTDRFEVDYEGPWLLTGFRVFPPCGDARDLFDRLKGRALTNLGIEEDEENWNQNSSYLGGLVGPIRAIRYVRGATSGFNTLHHDIVYPGYWRRVVNLRVHPLAMASLYIDWNPDSSAAFYSPAVPDGVPIDGVVDDVPASFVDRALVRTSGGGLAVLHDIPPSPLIGTLEMYYRDDADYDDALAINPGYGDEDDSAYGDHGPRLLNLADSTLQPIAIRMSAYPLCAGVGDEDLADQYDQLRRYPLHVTVAPQTRELTAVRALAADRDAADVVLAWEEIAGADGYRVFGTDDPTSPPDSWPSLGEPSAATYRDVGAAEDPAISFYSVVALRDGAEGPP